jgi:TolC family type I secretion outer membrane protein
MHVSAAGATAPARLSRGLAPAAFAATLWASAAGAMTLEDALASAYATNPQLASARATLRRTDELVPQALAVGRPSVSIGGGVGLSDTQGAGPVGAVDARMPIWTAGRVGAAAAQAREAVQAGQEQLVAAEEDVLLRATTAYVDVLRAQGVVDATREHERALQADLDSAQRRQAAGLVTATDVAGNRSQLAAATARRTQAEGDLEIAREVFRSIIGADPGRLSPPPPAPNLPATRDEAILAADDNPQNRAAVRNVAAAESGVEAAIAQLRPSLAAQATVTFGYQAGVLLTVPLYDGGLVAARTRAAREDLSARRLDLDAQRRNSRQSAVTAWQALTTARASIDAYTVQVDSARATRDGVRREMDQGLRTELQVLQAEQNVIDAELNLLGARRDSVVAAYQLLAATGRLTAAALALPVESYDPTAHAASASRKGWDWSIEKEAYRFGGTQRR